MSPEFEALRLAIVAAMNEAAERAYKQNPDIPDEEYDGAKADAALRVVAEAMREPSDTFALMDAVRDALSNGEGELRESDMPKMWRAMLAASPIAEALRDE
jgi:hypothetical protein